MRSVSANNLRINMRRALASVREHGDVRGAGTHASIPSARFESRTEARLKPWPVRAVDTLRAICTE